MSAHARADWRVLMSAEAARRVGPRLAEIGQRARCVLKLVVFQPDRPYADLGSVNAAFFSRDLWRGSTWSVANATSNAFFDALARGGALRWLHVFSSGSDLALYQRAPEGCRVTTSAGVSAVAMAQSVLGAVLYQARGFARLQAAQHRREWDGLAQHAMTDLQGKCAVVVGTGHVGREAARLLQALGVRVVGVSRSARPAPMFEASVTPLAMDAHLPGCDWVVLACPLTDATRNLFDARRLALLPPRAGLINVGRGGLVDEVVLVERLRQGRLGWAYLDAFDPEPLAPDSPLWDAPNILVSPHASAVSDGNAARVADLFLDNLQRLLLGEPLRNEVQQHDGPVAVA